LVQVLRCHFNEKNGREKKIPTPKDFSDGWIRFSKGVLVI
jgi:hypothetical protein